MNPELYAHLTHRLLKEGKNQQIHTAPVRRRRRRQAD